MPCQMQFDSLEAKLGNERSLVCLPIKTLEYSRQVISRDGSPEPKTTGYETSVLALEEVLCLGPRWYRRIGYFDLLNEHWVEGSGIICNRDGQTLYSTDGGKLTITLV